MATTLTQPNTKASTNPANNVAPLNLYNTVTGAKLNTGETYVNALGQTITQGTPVANQSTTTLSSANPTAKIPAIQNKTSQLSQTGITTTMDANGNPITTTANGAVYTPNPVIVDQNFANTHDMSNPAYANYKVSNATVTETGTTPTGGYYGDQYIPPNSKVPTDTAGTPVILQDVPASSTKIINGLNDLISKNDANTANLISSIKSQYESLIAQQKETNASAEAGTRAYSIMGGRGVVSSDNVVNQQVSYGIKQVADLTSKEMSAITQAQIAGDNQDYQLQDKINNEIETIRKEKQDVATKIKDNLIEAKKKLDEQISQAQKDSIISEIFSPSDGTPGTTNPVQILTKLRAMGDKTTTLKDINDTLGNIANIAGVDVSKLSADTQEFYQLKNQVGGLPISVLSKPTIAEQILEYEKLKTQAKTKVTPAGSSSGTGSMVTNTIDPTTGTVSKSILAATGLSMPAFMFLTTGTAALTRMTADQRVQYMNEAENYVNRTGTDIATFRSQYSALSKTVEANLLRNNQAAVAESELDATIKNVASASMEANLGNLSKLNAAKIWTGKQLNTKEATTFKFHLEQLRREFAMYNAAIEGQIDANGNIRQITDADLQRADQIINDGFAEGSIEGFETALKNSREKMKVVLENSINAQNKQVWKLFGIEDKYQAPTSVGGSTVDDFLNNPLPGQGGTQDSASFWGKAK